MGGISGLRSIGDGNTGPPLLRCQTSDNFDPKPACSCCQCLKPSLPASCSPPCVRVGEAGVGERCSDCPPTWSKPVNIRQCPTPSIDPLPAKRNRPGRARVTQSPAGAGLPGSKHPRHPPPVPNFDFNGQHRRDKLTIPRSSAQPYRSTSNAFDRPHRTEILAAAKRREK